MSDGLELAGAGQVRVIQPAGPGMTVQMWRFIYLLIKGIFTSSPRTADTFLERFV